METDRLHRLIDRYFDAGTSVAEERELRALLLKADQRDPRVREALAVMSFAAMPPRAEIRKPARRGGLIRHAAAAVALLAVAAGGVTLYNASIGAGDECYAYMGGRKTENPDRVMQLMQSDLEAVGEASQQIDSEIRGEWEEIRMISENQ